MSRTILLIALFGYLLASSCTEEKMEQPFSDEKIVNILTDMYLIEASIAGKPPEQADSLKTEYREILMNDYQMDSTDLRKMERFLKNKPEISKELHDKARNRIDQLQKSVN